MINRFSFVTVTVCFAVSSLLNAQSATTIEGQVTRSEAGIPVAGALVSVIGENRTVVTRSNGRYSIRVSPGQHTLRVTRVGYVPAMREVRATASEKTIADFEMTVSVVQLIDVVSVGTRGVEKTNTESTVPVDLFSAELIENTGMPELWQVMNHLLPSLNVPHIPRGDDGVRPVTLRGMAPQHVLVLVDGKRVHSGAVVESGPVLNSGIPVDINTIPSSAIERIEVLRDGAAAQYGSDAIAGVVNIILKRGEHREWSMSAGEVYSSEGGRNFRDGRTLGLNAIAGFAGANGRQLTVSADLRARGPTNRAYPDLRQQYFTGDVRNDLPARISSYEGNGDVRDASILVNASTPTGAHAELYATSNVNFRKVIGSTSVFRRPLDTRTVRALYPDGYLPETHNDAMDVSTTGGYRVHAGAFHIDISSTFGRNDVDLRVEQTNNVSLGGGSATAFDIGSVTAEEWTSNVDVSRPVVSGRVLRTSFFTGAEYRWSHFTRIAGEPDSYRDGGVPILDGDSAGKAAPVGSQGVGGVRPLDEADVSRSDVAMYIGLENRLLSRLTIDAAERVENYSDFGTTWTGKIAARFEIIHGLAIRGSVSSGFRAPSLAESYAASTRTVLRLVNGVNTSSVVRTLPVNSPEARLLGAKDLEPERSRNATAGVMLSLPKLPSVTIDYYSIKLDDRIVTSGEFTGPSVAQLFEQNGMRGITGGRYFANAIDTRTSGVDIVATYGMRVGVKHWLRFSASANSNETQVTRVSSTPPALQALQSVLFSRAQKGAMELGQPRHRTILATNYSNPRITVNLEAQRFGPTALLDQASPDRDQVVGAKWISDLGVFYKPASRIQVGITVSNMFDVYPDEWNDFKDGVDARGMSMNGIFRYPGGISAFGMNGRTIYVHARYR